MHVLVVIMVVILVIVWEGVHVLSSIYDRRRVPIPLLPIYEYSGPLPILKGRGACPSSSSNSGSSIASNSRGRGAYPLFNL